MHWQVAIAGSGTDSATLHNGIERRQCRAAAGTSREFGLSVSGTCPSRVAGMHSPPTGCRRCSLNTHDDSFMTLCNLWCEKQLTAEQLQELQTLLRSDRGLQRLFVEFTQLHGLLAWDAGVIAGSGLNGIGRDGALQPSIDCQIVPEVRQRGSSSTVRDSLVVPALAGKCDEYSWPGRLNCRLKAGLRTDKCLGSFVLYCEHQPPTD